MGVQNATKIIILITCILFTACAIEIENNILHQLENLNFENIYANTFEEEVFYNRVKPTPLGTPTILHINNDVASILDLDFSDLDHFRNSSEYNTLCEYLSGSKILKGSDPIAIPLLERGWVRPGDNFENRSVAIERFRYGGILLGTIRNNKGELWDLFLKGTPINIGDYKEKGSVSIENGIREMIISEALHYLGFRTRRTIAILTHEKQLSENSFVTLLQVAKSHIRMSTLNYFLVNGQKSNAESLMKFVLHNYLPPFPMKENPPCTTDDDDDEGDDDEYCYSKGAPELIAQLNVNYFRIFQEWRDINFAPSYVSTSLLSLDGTILELEHSSFVQLLVEEEKLLHCANLTDFRVFRKEMKLLIRDFGIRMGVTDSVFEPFVKLVESQKNEIAYYSNYLKNFGLDVYAGDSYSTYVSFASSRSVIDFFRFRRNLADLLPQSTTTSVEEDSVDETVRESVYRFPSSTHKNYMNTFIRSVREHLQEQYQSIDRRKLFMNSYNPFFVPREWIIREALSNLISGDLSYFKALLASLTHPYDEEHPRDWSFFHKTSEIYCSDSINPASGFLTLLF